MSIVKLKISLVKKQSRHGNAQLKAGARHSCISEMAVFTVKADYSGDKGYPFNNSRQLGNMS